MRSPCTYAVSTREWPGTCGMPGQFPYVVGWLGGKKTSGRPEGEECSANLSPNGRRGHQGWLTKHPPARHCGGLCRTICAYMHECMSTQTVLCTYVYHHPPPTAEGLHVHALLRAPERAWRLQGDGMYRPVQYAGTVDACAWPMYLRGEYTGVARHSRNAGPLPLRCRVGGWHETPAGRGVGAPQS